MDIQFLRGGGGGQHHINNKQSTVQILGWLSNLGVAEDKKSEESEDVKVAVDRPRGRSGEVGGLLGLRTAFVRPPRRTFGSTPARTYLS